MIYTPFRHKSDLRLLEKLRENDETALRLLYDRYVTVLYNRAYSVLRKKEEAEEVVQDVFIKLWNYRHTVVIHTSFQAYIFQMCRNLVVDYIRARAQSLPLSSVDTADLEHHSQNNTESDVIFDEYLRRYHHAVDTLPPRRKTVYLLCQVEGKSYDQAARQLSISRDAVKDHIVKATRFIKQSTGMEEIALRVVFALLVYGHALPVM